MNFLVDNQLLLALCHLIMAGAVRQHVLDGGLEAGESVVELRHIIQEG